MSEVAKSTELPLAGLVVIDLTQWFAGPVATTWLGDMGANVIKVERPGVGDPTRHVDHVLGGVASSYFAGINRSKRSIELDLSSAEGIDALRRLIAKADVLVENFRPGVMSRLGLDYGELSAVNERLIYCAVSSFGEFGPLAQRPGMDIVIQAMGGVMGLTGPSGGSPIRVGAPVADYVGALQTTVAISVALAERARSGKGQRVDVSLMEGQIAMLSNYIAGYYVTGEPSGPVGNFHPQLVPYQPYETKDGSVIVACLTEQFWQKMCGALDLEELLVDPRFVTNIDRVAHREELNGLLEPLFAKMTSSDLTSKLEKADVPCAPIQTIADLIVHPQVVESKTILEMEHPRYGSYHAIAAPFRFERTPARATNYAPDLGEDTTAVLSEFGFSPDEIAQLEASTKAES
jgi:crotonobetainyl-CoA:carnitine CoA-transferase CaiB-like acyl-CoA transferase